MFSHASMNRIYRLIWSDVLGTWTAVAEHTRGRGKCNRSKLIAPALAAMSLSLGAHAASVPDPTTLPTGGKVVAGSAVIHQQGAAMTITQSTQRGAIDWNTFNLGAAASVKFVQPSSSAVTLNRVLDTQASQIFGKISANGQVFLTNASGVYFAPSASVDVGGLIATTHGIGNADFMAGSTTFTRDGATGSVVNDGQLHAGLNGYIALLAPQVRNNGVIVAQAGTVALASGEAISLQFGADAMLAGVVVTPSAIAALVENRQAVLAPGGRIILSAQAANSLHGGVVNNSGTLEASGLRNDGGHIVLAASDGIDHSGVIHADAAPGSTGNGGSVSIIADLANSASRTSIGGAISARGGALGGNGGSVETSGSQLRVADSVRVDTRAPAGKDGSWLLDPDGFTIAASGGDISGTALGNNLALGNVAIASTSGGGSDGNVTVNDAVSWSANKLTLTATNDVNVNAVMTASGAASLDLEPTAGKVNALLGPNNTFIGKVNFAGSGVLTIKNHVYQVVNSLGIDRNDMTPGTLQGIQASQNVYYALGSDIDATPTASWNSNGAIGMTQFSISSSGMDGLGHIITAPTIRNQSSLIYSLYGGPQVELRNLGVVGGSVIGGQYVSGLIGLNYGTVSNTFTTMSVTGFQYAGGMVGENRAGVIYNSHAGGDVSGTSYVGGLVGRMLDGTIEKSYATGNVTGSSAFIGGLVGNNYFGTIKIAYATGNVTGNQTVGGLVGLNQPAGSVTGSSINNTYATGNVNGTTNVGGLVGENGSTINNSYAIGAVTINNGNTSIGGLVGLENGASNSPSVITNSFWDTQTTGRATSQGGIGKTTAQMKAMATFTGAGWDFTTLPVWAIKPTANNGYPCLTAFANCPAPVALTVRVSGSQAGNVYGDAIGTFSYSLFNGATQLDANAVAGLGLAVSGGAVYGGAPTSGSGAGAYSVLYGSGLTLGGANAGDYLLAPGSAFSYAISKRPLALSATRAYDGTTAFQTAGLAATNLVGADCAGGLAACGMGGAASVASKNVSAGAQALSAGTLALSGALGSNYTLTGLSGTGTITPRAIAATASATGRAYDGGTAAQATLALGNTVVSGDTLSVGFAGASFADKNAGAGKTVTVSGIALGGADAGNYALAGSTATALATITPRALAVTGTGIDRSYDGSTMAGVAYTDDRVAGDLLSVAGTSSFASKNAGVGKTVNVTGLGATGADRQNYTLANTSLSTTATVSQRQLQLGASAPDRSYNGGTASVVTLTDDRVAGDTLTLGAASGSFADKNAGAAKLVTLGAVSVGGADAGNYLVAAGPVTTHASITPRAIDVVVEASGRVYDGGTAASANVFFNGPVVAGDLLSVSGAPGTFANKNVGTGKVVTVAGLALGGLDAGNYQLARTSATAMASITPRVLTVAASGNNRVYDGGTGATVSWSDNRVAGDVLTLGSTAAAFADKNAGAGKSISVTGISASGADSGNYTLSASSLTTSAAITQRLLAVTATAADRIYDGGTAATVTLADDRVQGDVLMLAATGAFADKNAATAKLVAVGSVAAGGADAGNYLVPAGGGTTHASITPRVVLAFATGIDRVYDGGTTAQVALALSDSVVAGDHLSVSGSASFADKNAGASKAVAVTGIALGGDDAGNYFLEAVQAQTRASVTVRALAVSARGVDRIYNGSNAASVTLDDNRIAGDMLSLSNASATFADKNAGADKAIAVGGIAMAGLDAGNYMLASTGASASATITPRQLQVSTTGVDRVYDGSLAAAVGFADNRIDGDVLTLAGTAKFGDKNVGAAKAIAVSAIGASGKDAGNYTVSATGAASASVTPRLLTVSATGIDKVFDAKDGAGVKLSDDRVAGDTLAVTSASAAFASLAVGKDKPVTVSGIGISGTDAANYRLAATSATTSATIVAGSTDEVPRLPAVEPVLPSTSRAASPLSLLAKAEPVLAMASANAVPLAMPESDGVKVTLVRGAARTQAGMIAVDVPKQMISKGDNFSFPLPKAVAEVLAVGGATATVKAADGSALPGWLKYDAQNKSFDVSAAPAKALPFELKIEVDGNRWTLVLAQGAGS